MYNINTVIGYANYGVYDVFINKYIFFIKLAILIILGN